LLQWIAETYAAFRSVVSIAKANSASVLDTIRAVTTNGAGGFRKPNVSNCR
jgi:hypothetical protein